MEAKLREQVAQLLTPMLGDGNFSSEIQIELDMDQLTSARESYDTQGVVRSETQSASQSSGASGAGGVPGVLSNTPPPATTAQPGAPQATPPAANAPPGAPAGAAAPGAPAGQPGATAPATNGETASTRNYELGREVAVSNTAPGKIKRLSVAVALSKEAMAKAKPQDIEQIKQLVSAAVGADPARGDQVAVALRSFQPLVVDPPKFYETPWFAMAVRNGVALIAVLLTLLLGVRPLIKALKRDHASGHESRASRRASASGDEDDEDADLYEDGEGPAQARPARKRAALRPAQDETGAIDSELLSRQVGLAQRMVQEKPDSAIAALRQMLKEPEEEPSA